MTLGLAILTIQLAWLAAVLQYGIIAGTEFTPVMLGLAVFAFAMLAAAFWVSINERRNGKGP